MHPPTPPPTPPPPWPAQKGQKCVQLETAVGMWQLLYSGDRRWDLIDGWVEFLTTEHKKARFRV